MAKAESSGLAGGFFLSGAFLITVVDLWGFGLPEMAGDHAWWPWLVARIVFSCTAGWAIAWLAGRLEPPRHRWLAVGLTVVGLLGARSAIVDLVTGPEELHGTIDTISFRLKGRVYLGTLRVREPLGRIVAITTHDTGARELEAAFRAGHCRQGAAIEIVALVASGRVRSLRCA